MLALRQDLKARALREGSSSKKEEEMVQGGPDSSVTVPPIGTALAGVAWTGDPCSVS